MACVN